MSSLRMTAVRATLAGLRDHAAFMRFLLAVFTAVFVLELPAVLRGAEPPRADAPATAFCNPLNLDYGPFLHGGRHAADPVIVLFKDRYYLFDTIDQPGYRVSDDLIHWRTIRFDAASWPLAAGPDGNGTRQIAAPAAVVLGDAIYYTTFDNPVALKSTDPLSGHWEAVGKIPPGGDPNFFLDDDGRLYETTGLYDTEGIELNPRDFTPLGPGRTILVPKVTEAGVTNDPYGPHRGREELQLASARSPNFADTSALLGNLKSESVVEGSWLTKHAGRYYLQNSSPGTATPWYSDAVYVSDRPLGPYRLADYSPVSLKVGGFINSAGHSCVFADRYGNLWRVTTMWVGNTDRFERRLGLFPVGFDRDGRMFTRTDFGDYPFNLPAGKWDAQTDAVRPGWAVLSTGKTCTASSTLDAEHTAEKAADEAVRTWWSARTGDAGEWFQMDLGRSCDVRAVQVNFAEQDASNEPASEDYHAYRLLVSTEGQTWQAAVDRTSNKTSVPHDYAAFPGGLSVRYLKVENVHAAKRGKFALRDLRVFGHGGGPPPATPGAPTLTRLSDPRDGTFTWAPTEGAEGYMIYYGTTPGALFVPLQVQGGASAKLTVSCLNRDVKYFCRVDAYNANGVTPGAVSSEAH